MPGTATAPSLLDALKLEEQRDLYGFYDRLRSSDPVIWDRQAKAWIVTSYDLVREAAGSPSLSSVRYPDLTRVPDALLPLAEVLSLQMLYRDAPDHTRLRKTASGLFTPKTIGSMKERITHLVDELLDAVPCRQAFDVIADFAYPLPVTVICEMLGIARNERVRMKLASADIAVVMSNPLPRAEQVHAATVAVTGLLEHFAALLDGDAARTEPDRAPLLVALREAEASGELERRETLANMVLLLIAGHETTTNLIGNGVLALLSNPEQLERLRSTEEGDVDWRRAIDELLRYDSPVQVLLRRARTDMELGGKDLEAGQLVLLMTGAANRDPSSIEDAHRLDLSREASRHVAFGHGPHACLGAALARLEGEVAFRRLLSRFPDLHLADPVDELRWHRTVSFRGLERLRVRTDPPASDPRIA